jgi:anti-anti-sigma regulatory factor
VLRIRKIVDSPSETTLHLEGKVTAEWVAVLEEECGKVLRETRRIRLDLTAVDFIDPRGVTLLRRLAAHHLTIVNAAVYIQALLSGSES